MRRALINILLIGIKGVHVTGKRTAPTLISSVRRALRLLEEVSESPGGGTAKYLSRRSGIALPTTYHLLRTLVHDGYLVKLDDGAFVLGSRMADMTSASGQHTAHREIRTALGALRDELQAATYLARYTDGEIDIAEIVDGPRTPRVDTWVNFREAAHATAIGKCLLGHLNAAARSDHYNRHPPKGLTHRTTTQVRELVHSHVPRLVTDTEEYALGVACAAVPVQVSAAEPVCVALSVPVRRLADVRRRALAMNSVADRIGRALAVSG
jgi:DNA-binding IclR family transcriptional regulator